MKRIFSIIRGHTLRLYRDTRGQSMVIVAGALAVLLGIGALTTDMGYLYVQRRNSQNIADSAALAGTWVMHKGDSEVDKLAKDIAEEHGFNREDIEAKIVDKMYVEAKVKKQHNLFLAKILNINAADVSAQAKATRSSMFIPGHKDVLPLGLVGWVDIFYKVDASKLQNKDEYYKLFNDKKHELYDEFSTRPGILKDEIKQYLLNKNPSFIYVDQGTNDFKIPAIPTESDKYPTWETSEKLLQTDLTIYKEALQILVDEDPEQLFDIVFGSSSLTGSFGFIDLDVPGAAELRNIIDNGFDREIDEIEAETGFISNVGAKDGPLDNYITRRGDEAFIFSILPSALKGGKWEAKGPNADGDFREYLVLHVVDMELKFETGKDPRLVGKINEIFTRYDQLTKSNEGRWEEGRQSWLVR